MGLGDMVGAAKAINLTDEQKAMVKKVVKEAAGNKEKIAAEVKKLGLPIKEEQLDMVIGLVEKL